jgi:hypothetical protein
MNMQQIITELSRFPGRIGLAEEAVCQYLCKRLNDAGIAYQVQEFSSQTPDYKDASLVADGQAIECLPCGLISGEITTTYNLISSLTSSQPFIDTPNINFNPKSDVIGTPNYYFAPALAVSRRDLPQLMAARNVVGRLVVEPQAYVARNILIGNTTHPRAVVFAHYDGYFSAATDNASGVAALLSVVARQPDLLKDNLFVLAGNEELSYDYPVYWGRGFRQFQVANPGVLERAQKICVVDCIGDGDPVVMRDSRSAQLAFPVHDPDIATKTSIITGSFDTLMSVYHSPVDQPKQLHRSYLDAAVTALAAEVGR